MKKIIFGLVAVLAFNVMAAEKLELNGFHSVEKNLKQELG